MHLLLRADSSTHPVGNLLMDMLVGATINHYSAEQFSDLSALYERWVTITVHKGVDRKLFLLAAVMLLACGVT